MHGELEEVRRSLEEEQRARAKLQNELRNAQSDCDTLRDQVEEESEAKSDVSQLSVTGPLLADCEVLIKFSLFFSPGSTCLQQAAG